MRPATAGVKVRDIKFLYTISLLSELFMLSDMTAGTFLSMWLDRLLLMHGPSEANPRRSTAIRVVMRFCIKIRDDFINISTCHNAFADSNLIDSII